MTTVTVCKEQKCSQKIRAGHFLCRDHWQQSQEGVINECPQCGVYKDTKYPLCIDCNKKTSAKTRPTRREIPKSSAEPQPSRHYDAPKADTFAERSALLEDDQKAKDKRLLFEEQEYKCVYCATHTCITNLK